MDIISYLLGKNSAGTPAVFEEKSANITSIGQEIVPSEGFNGMSKVTVDSVGAGVDSNIVASNIRKGVEILGVEGTYGSEVVPPEAGTLTGLLIGSMPTKTAYVEGDALDLTGLVVLGAYSNGFNYDVTNDCTFVCNDPVTFYDTKIAAQYQGFTLDIAITVAGKPVQAPADTVQLYHFDGNLKEEVSDTTTSGSANYTGGKFDRGLQPTGWVGFKTLNWPYTFIQTGSFTIEFWCKVVGGTSSTKHYGKAVEKMHSSSGYGRLFSTNIVSSSGVALETSSGSSNPGIAANNIRDNLPPASFDIAQWHHVALVVSSGTFQTYLDGVKSCHGSIRTGSYMDIYQLNIEQTSPNIDELLVTTGVKYSDNFEPPHGPYYLQGGE